LTETGLIHQHKSLIELTKEYRSNLEKQAGEKTTKLWEEIVVVSSVTALQAT
jgi:hypothetical protein